MATAPTHVSALLDLHNGDRMTRKVFHRIYERMPKHFRAELIGGIVYVPSPLKRPHGTFHPRLSTLLFVYESHTPGVETGDNTTILLGQEGEPQPDLFLRILPEYGGQSRDTKKGYVAGAPELLMEIAESTRSIDLFDKRADYARYHVLEYVVACLRERELRWFDLRTNRERQPDADGIYRLQSFPGLWIDSTALFAKDYVRLMTALQAGLDSPEHAAFVRKLELARSRRKEKRRKK